MDIVCLYQLILSAAVNFISIFFVRAILFELTTEAFIYKFSMWKTLYHSTKKNKLNERKRGERERQNAANRSCPVGCKLFKADLNCTGISFIHSDITLLIFHSILKYIPRFNPFDSVLLFFLHFVSFVFSRLISVSFTLSTFYCECYESGWRCFTSSLCAETFPGSWRPVFYKIIPLSV